VARVLTGALEAAAKIAGDPCLPVVIREIQAIEPRRRPGEPPPRGVGLCHLVKPIKAFAFYQRYPWLVIAGTAGVLALTFYIGYRAGR
jgi:hypothetical protein